jgi:hypothetical protein
MVTKVEEKLIKLRLAHDIDPESFLLIKTVLNEHPNAKVYQANKKYYNTKEWRFMITTKALIGRDTTEKKVTAILAFEMHKTKISRNRSETQVRWQYRQIEVDGGVTIKNHHQKNIGYVPDYKMSSTRIYDLASMKEEDIADNLKSYEKLLFKEAKSLSDRHIKAEKRRIEREEKKKNDLIALKEKLFKRHNISGASAEKLYEIVCVDNTMLKSIEKTFEQYVEVLKV